MPAGGEMGRITTSKTGRSQKQWCKSIEFVGVAMRRLVEYGSRIGILL